MLASMSDIDPWLGLTGELDSVYEGDYRQSHWLRRAALAFIPHGGQRSTTDQRPNCLVWAVTSDKGGQKQPRAHPDRVGQCGGIRIEQPARPSQLPQRLHV